MDRDLTRRALLSALVGGGIAGAALSPAGSYLDRFAPFSGTVWGAAREDLPSSVDSEYGEATMRYDDEGVAHVEADDERAAYFAAGYAQAADRLFQMDLQRRQMRGTLSEVVGEATLASDRFHAKMDFAGAAEATWERVQDTETGAVVEAYVDGVERFREQGDLPVEFRLLGFEPDPWTPVDSMLGEKQISWGLTGSFRTLRKETLAAELGEDVADTLMPHRMAHDATILGHERGEGHGNPPASLDDGRDREARATHPDLESWLGAFESPDVVGSNSWLVDGEHTASGQPVMANDPHLNLMAPPVWYEMHVVTPAFDVRGVTFPGVPFVVIGENEGGAWGFTNAGCDVVDFYEYETRDGEYRYGDEWRAFDTETRTIEVAGSEDREVTVRKTVHGPVLGTEGDGDELRTEVGVAWTGFAATRTTEAVRAMNHSDGIEEFEAALRRFDLPTQNCVYADREGNTLYRVTGKVPIRRTDGEPVPGTRVFDGSEREGEWPGYTPYGRSSWDGFIPFDEMPAVRDPGYVGTANQRVVDDADYPHYFAEAYSPPFRGMRLWERLDERVASDDPVTPAFVRDLQRDAHDKRAELFVPTLLDAAGDPGGDLGAALETLRDWDYRMTRDSRGALVFDRFMEHYREAAFAPRLDALGERREPSAYYGNDWVLIHLDDGWFPEGRTAAVHEALRAALDEIDAEGWEVYGDYNRTAIDHPFDREFLNYPRYPTDGSEATLNNYRKDASVGSSWRQVCPMDGDSSCILPGGNDGSPFSEHYHDQLRRWADGEYKPMARTLPDEVTIEFGGER